jgi:hypothetical protein
MQVFEVIGFSTLQKANRMRASDESPHLPAASRGN